MLIHYFSLLLFNYKEILKSYLIFKKKKKKASFLWFLSSKLIYLYGMICAKSFKYFILYIIYILFIF